MGIYAVTACDIMYDLAIEKLVKKGEDDMAHVFDKFDEAPHLYTWKYYSDKDESISLRRKALGSFADDFTKGYKEKRHVHGILPWLPFADNAFLFALSGHFLFLYGYRIDLDFHKACIKESVRVTKDEVRMFPLVGLDARQYPYLDVLLAFVSCLGVRSEITEAPFEFQTGAGKMIRLSRMQDHKRG